MKKFITILFLLFEFAGFGQSETHDFRTFDTTINAGYSGITWRLRISMPNNYFTANHADTASRPIIFTIPGQGEMGTNYNTLDNWGPFYETSRGWDGSVVLGNGTHFPILITAISSNTFMSGKEAADIIAKLKNWLHPKYIVCYGLSQGAFAISSMMLVDSAAAKVKAFACFHGRSNEYQVGNTPSELLWGSMAKKYDIRFFGLEGNASDNFREVWRISNRIHDSIPGNAYFGFTSVAGGAHGGWDTIYSIYQTNWRSIPTYGPYNSGTQGSGVVRMGTYTTGNVYQWGLRQGDTTLVGGNSAPTADAGTDITITLPTNSTTLSGSGTDTDGTIASYSWSQISGTSATIVSPSSASTNITGLTTSGARVFRLTVTDDDGATDTDDITVTVNAAPTPQKYTWNSSTTNILISDAGAFGDLNCGDTVFIPVRSGGYRSYSIQNVSSGTEGCYIVVYWQPGAYRTPSGSNNLADIIDNANGVKTVGMEATGHVDQWRHGTTAYSSNIWFDSCDFSGSNGFGPVVTGALPNFAGDTTNTFRRWKWTNCNFVGAYDNNGGKAAIIMGGSLNGTLQTRYNFWFRPEIANCTFGKYYSVSNLPSVYIQAWKIIGGSFHDLTMDSLGMVTNPTGHASLINAYAFQGDVYNIRGKGNFGNIVRGKFADYPSLGSEFTGRSRIWNWIIYDQRKYPLVEAQATDTTGFGGGYVRPRTAPEVWSITYHRAGVGAGNSAYHAAIVDTYLDSVSVKNSVLIEVKDTTWGGAWGPNIYASSGSTVTYKDTSNNRLIQNWSNTIFSDSTNYTPASGGILHNTGLTNPVYRASDALGRSVPIGLPDIGAVERLLDGRQRKRINKLINND